MLVVMWGYAAPPFGLLGSLKADFILWGKEQ